MVQTSKGVTHNGWIAFMKACVTEYMKQKAEAKLKASAESANSHMGKSKRSKREVKEHAEPQISKRLRNQPNETSVLAETIVSRKSCKSCKKKHRWRR